MMKSRKRPSQFQFTCDYCVCDNPTRVVINARFFNDAKDYMLNQLDWYFKCHNNVWKHCCSRCVSRIMSGDDDALKDEITKKALKKEVVVDEPKAPIDLNMNAHKVSAFMKYRDKHRD